MLRPNPQNHILGLLPETTIAAWAPYMETVNLPMGKVLYEPGSILRHIHFPTTAIASCIYVLENGASTELAMAGREGVVGMYQLMGSGKCQNRTIVQTAGQAVRVPLSVVLDSFSQDAEVRRILLLYIQALITQMAQIAVYHRHHTVDQQLSRMLLQTLQRMDGDTIVLTHEVLASLLGVRREGVTLAAKRLMRAGTIRYSRGRITVLNRPQLESSVCECYGVITQEYDRLLQMSETVHH
jgi:CRP-like cAMP-binding protein